MRIAAAQYPVEFVASWRRYSDKIAHWVKEAAHAGADVVVFPEYAALELASLYSAETYASPRRQFDALQEVHDAFVALYADLATSSGCYLVAPSFPVRDGDGVYRSRVYLFGPSGRLGSQDKLMLTAAERERLHLAPGSGQRVFHGPAGLFAVTVGYDAEFPLLPRRLAQAGAGLVLVPSASDTQAGYHRRRWCCQARAVENQCYVVHATTVSRASWSPIIDFHVGAAGVFAPPAHGLSDNGILALGTMGRAAWVYADVDLDALEALRQSDPAGNHRAWDAHVAQAQAPARIV